MAFTFPLALNQFFDGLPISVFGFDLGEAVEMNETGGGEILTADIGNRLWMVECEIALGRYASIEQIKAKLNILRYAGRSLIIHSMPLYRPQFDPTGSILGASSVVLNAVHANNRDIKLGGLPVGYQMTAGDFLSFQYGSNPTRYALHQVVSGGTADGAGITGYFEVVPFIQPGYTLAGPVKLIKPEMKAILKPGSFDPGKSSKQFTEGVKFTLIQTYR